MVDTKKLIDEIVEGFIEKWGELNPDVNHGIEFAVEYLQKQQGQPDEELVEKIINLCRCPGKGGKKHYRYERKYLSEKIQTLLHNQGSKDKLGKDRLSVTWEQFEKAMSRFVKNWNIIEMQDWLESLGIKIKEQKK